MTAWNRDQKPRSVRPHRRVEAVVEGSRYFGTFYQGGDTCVMLKGFVKASVPGHWRLMSLDGPKALRIIAVLRRIKNEETPEC